MKNINKYLIAGLAILLIASCNKIEDLNQDIKKPNEVPGYTLFANAQKNLADQTASTNVNRNVFRLFAQYWTETTYIDESNYNITPRSIPDNEFRTMYRDVLRDLKEARAIIETEDVAGLTEVERNAKLAIVDVMAVYAWQREVDIFGDIPYSEALDIANVLPKYDDAETIYSDLFAKLDHAISNLDPAIGTVFIGDNIYGGNVGAWKAFANSLKLKMGVHVSDVPSLNPGTRIADAVADGVFQSSADNAGFGYAVSPPNTNPLYIDLVASGRFDFVPANTIVDLMKDLNDPRLDNYCDQNLAEYTGGIYGSSNTYSDYTHINPAISDPSAEVLLMSYSEIQFYMAEAIEKGLLTGTAAENYSDGIRASIIYWGGTNLEADTYLAQNSVQYAAAAGDYKQKIGTQAWLASYNRGFEGWTTWRRLDYPTLNPPDGMTNADIPLRYTYPGNEQTLNGTNYTSAANAIGGDLMSTPIFWDVN